MLALGGEEGLEEVFTVIGCYTWPIIRDDDKAPTFTLAPIVGLLARSARPFAWLEFAHRISMFSSATARPNYVMPWPPIVFCRTTSKTTPQGSRLAQYRKPLLDLMISMTHYSFF
jgi:hypothetical protein